MVLIVLQTPLLAGALSVVASEASVWHHPQEAPTPHRDSPPPSCRGSAPPTEQDMEARMRAAERVSLHGGVPTCCVLQQLL